MRLLRTERSGDLAPRLIQLVTGALVVAYTLSTALRRAGTASSFFDSWVGNLGYGGCVLLCAWRAATKSPRRLAWAIIAFSLALFTAGAVLWTTTVQYRNPVPYPSISDVFFLAFYPVAFVGVGLLIHDSLPQVSGGVWLDGLIAALGVAALEATFVISRVSHASRGTPAAVATNIAYPIGDLVLVMMIVSVFAIHGWRPERKWWMLGCGFTVFAAADTLYVLRVTAGTYVTGTPLDSLWLVGTCLVAVAAWMPPGRRTPQPRSQQVVIPTCFLLTSLFLVAADGTLLQITPLAVGLAAAALLSAFAKLGHSYQQLRTLAQTRRDALTDELTGLGNRRLLMQEAQTLLRRSGNRATLLLMDLNRFKEVNDAFGHAVGDEVLAAFGRRLRRYVRSRDLLVRLGGDEFALALSDSDSDYAIEIAQRIAACLRQPFELSRLTASIGASVGIALAPEHASDISGLLRCADVAMYKAKAASVDYAVYDLASDHGLDRFELLEDLRTAIRKRALVLYYQPQVDLATRTVRSVEALVRWPHPTRGLVTPDEFIPLAEDSQQMRPLTDLVLDMAIGQAAEWDRQGLGLSVAVNLSAANLLDGQLPGRVSDLLASNGLHPERLILEITETALMADPPRARTVVGDLHELGVRISVDDFGTGYSSLAYLRDLAVDELKLDRSFLRTNDGTVDSQDTAIAESVLHLGHTLGLRVVAEGVEHASTLDTVVAMGFDVAQGYHLGRPVPAGCLTVAAVSGGTGDD